MRYILLILVMILTSDLLLANTKVKKNVKYRQTQEVNFEQQDIDGLARTPAGSYLVQKRGVDFIPLYKVRDRLDTSIEDSIEHLR